MHLPNTGNGTSSWLLIGIAAVSLGLSGCGGGGGSSAGSTTAIQDADGDGIEDSVDVCPLVADAAQTDANSNGVGAECEVLPVATSATLEVITNVAKTFTLEATDAQGDTLSYDLGTPTSGTLSGTAPEVTYTPTTDFTGSDSFTFTVSDGEHASESATITITVAAATASLTWGTGSWGEANWSAATTKTTSTTE